MLREGELEGVMLHSHVRLYLETLQSIEDAVMKGDLLINGQLGNKSCVFIVPLTAQARKSENQAGWLIPPSMRIYSLRHS